MTVRISLQVVFHQVGPTERVTGEAPLLVSEGQRDSLLLLMRTAHGKENLDVANALLSGKPNSRLYNHRTQNVAVTPDGSMAPLEHCALACTTSEIRTRNLACSRIRRLTVRISLQTRRGPPQASLWPPR